MSYLPSVKWLAWIGALVVSSSQGQEWNFSVFPFGLDKGLRTQTTHNSILDHSGFRWVSTSRGLHRIEGKQARPVALNEASPHYIADVTVSSSGKLWCVMGWDYGIDATESSLGLFDPETFECLAWVGDNVPTNAKLVRFEGTDDVYLVGFANTLFRLDETTGQMKEVYSEPDVLFVSPVNEGFLGGQKLFLAQTESGSFRMWHFEEGKWQSDSLPPEAELGAKQRCVEVGANGRVCWVGLVTDQLMEWSVAVGFRLLEDNWIQSLDFSQGYWTSVCRGDSDQIWFLHGANVQVFHTHIHQFLGQFELPGYEASPMAMTSFDFEGPNQAWISTAEGLYHVHMVPDVFKELPLRPQLIEPACRAIAEVGKDSLCVLTDNGRLHLRTPTEFIEFQDGYEIADFAATDAGLWSVYGVDIRRTDWKTGQLEVVGKAAEWTRLNWSVTADETVEHLYFGEHALQVFNIATGTCQRYELASSTSETTIQSLRWVDDILWAMTTTGIWQWKDGDERLLPWHPAEAVPVQTWFDLLPGENGMLWFATSNQGLLGWHSQTKDWTQFSLNSGLVDSRVYAVESDQSGRLWLSSDRGLVSVNPETQQVRPFGSAEGIKELEFNRASHHRGQDGKLYFGGIHGFLAFDPMKTSSITSVVPTGVGLVDFLLFESESSELRSVRAECHRNNRVTMGHEDGFALIRVCTLGSPFASQVMRYRILGQADLWQESFQTEFRIGGLTPGEFVFEVQVMGADGLWSEENGLRLPIRVVAPLHQRPEGRAAIAVSALFGVVAFGFARRRRLELANRKLEINVEERTQKLNESLATLQETLDIKEIYLSEMHHRVKNNLQVIAGLLKLQRQGLSHPAAKEALAGAQFRVDAMGRIHQKLTHNAAESTIAVEPLLQQLFDLLAYQHPHLEVHLELQIAASELDGDTGIALGMIVNELLMNSFKHGFGEGFEREVARIRIDVSEQELKGHFVLLYEDNGAGMPTGAEWVTDERLGMRLIHQLARQLMGRLELKGSPRTQWVFHFLDEQRRRTID